MDCVDEATNTHALLVYLAERKCSAPPRNFTGTNSAGQNAEGFGLPSTALPAEIS
jgi:hypothetical protein